MSSLNFSLIFVAITALSLPVCGQGTLEGAQLDDFTTDNGTLTMVDGQQYTGKLKFSAGLGHNVVIWPDDKRTSLLPNQVKFFSLYQRYFIATNQLGNIPTQGAPLRTNTLLIQLADTGKLQLARRYKDDIKSERIDKSAGELMQAISSPVPPRYDLVVWWLRKGRSGAWTEIPMPSLGGYTSKKFRKVMANFLTDRPDLLSSLESEALTYKDVEQAIRAYNSGEPTFFTE